MVTYVQILHTVIAVALIAYNLLFDYWFKNFNNEFYFQTLSIQKRLSRKEFVIEKDFEQLQILFKYKVFRIIRFVVGKNKTIEIDNLYFVLTELLRRKEYRKCSWSTESKFANKEITKIVRTINDLHGPLSRNSERFGAMSGVIVLISYVIIYFHQLMVFL